jgi:Ca-activated chloride channel family protein
LEWSEDFTPVADWGSKGDPNAPGGSEGGSEGDSGYKKVMFRCLICDGAPSGNPFMISATPPPDVDEGRAEPEADVGAPTVEYLSADDSNSQSSPVLIRSLIMNDMVVTGDMVRIWEFLNYYNFEYGSPGQASLTVTQQLRPIDLSEGRFAHQIGVQGRLLAHSERPRFGLTLVLDTSGSMSGDKIETLKHVCRSIAASLRPGDVISMVTWNTEQITQLEGLAVDGPNDPRLLEVIESLSADGGTDLHSGLVRGYILAATHYLAQGVNRVVLISDGGANVGVTDAQLIGYAASNAEMQQIFLVGVGVGSTQGYPEYNDELMDTVTDLGKGASLYVDSKEEAKKMFEERFASTMAIAARDVRVELTLPPGFSIDEYFGEEHSKDKDEIEPQHLGLDDAMIYQEALKTKWPEQLSGSAEIKIRVTYTDVGSGEQGEVYTASTLQQLVDAPCVQLRKGDAILAYAQALGRIDRHVALQRYDDAFATCEGARDAVAAAQAALLDPDLEEIGGLLSHYCQSLRKNLLNRAAKTKVQRHIETSAFHFLEP